MSAEVASTSGESRNTLLLYCPYDRRVTRHSRRGPDNNVICVECGRRLEVSHTERTAPIPLVPAETTYAGPRSARARRVAVGRRRSATPWAPFMLVGAVTVGALFALMTALGVVANPLGPGREGPAAVIAAVPVIGGFTSSEQAPAPEAELSSPVAASQLRVANTGGSGVYLRRTPNMNDRVRAWADGTALKVVGPDTSQNGVDWKHVQDPAGNEGWIPAQYTAPAS